MNIIEKFKKLCEISITLMNWDNIIKEKENIAIYGNRSGYDEIKVQTSLKVDRLENAVIALDEEMEQWRKLFNVCSTLSEELESLIEKYSANTDDYIKLLDYKTRCLKGNSRAMPKAALKRIQNAIDFGEQVAKQPKAVQKLLRGEKCKCKHCENGYIEYVLETPERFIFQCTDCNYRAKSDKIFIIDNAKEIKNDIYK